MRQATQIGHLIMSKHKTAKRTTHGKARTVEFKTARRNKRILALIEERAFTARLGHDI